MLPDIKRILYATDMGQNSIHAFGYAVQMVKLTGADVHILHVVEQLSNDAVVTLQIYVMDATKRREILEQRIKRAEDALKARQDDFWAGQDEATQALRQHVKSMMVRESYPAEEILKTVKRENCDLIIMGGHEKGLSHTFLGGVAKSVLRRSRVPTMIVPLPGEDD